MNHLISTATALALGMTLSTAAFAQTTVTGVRAISDRIDDVEDDVRQEFERSQDAARFGNPEFRQGLSGSASLSYSGKSGNNETQGLTAGARLRFAQGRTVQTIGAVLDFSEFEGVRTREDIFGVYDFNYYFNDNLYGFVLARAESNGLATTADETKTDAFVGFGPGYRVINRPDLTWRVQAGIGVSYLEDGVGDSDTEMGYIASSRLFYQFSDMIFMTNDTDVLMSDSALRVNNDLGLNFKMTDAFSTRLSYLSDYNDSRAIKTDNTIGLALIYSF